MNAIDCEKIKLIVFFDELKSILFQKVKQIRIGETQCLKPTDIDTTRRVFYGNQKRQLASYYYIVAEKYSQDFLLMTGCKYKASPHNMKDPTNHLKWRNN